MFLCHISSPTDGKLSGDKDYVLNFSGFLMHHNLAKSKSWVKIGCSGFEYEGLIWSTLEARVGKNNEDIVWLDIQ